MSAILENGFCIFTTALSACLIGAIPFGYIIGRMHGKDIRKEGSGNIGATNVTRVIGKSWGRLCFLLDFLKGALPVLVITFLTPKPLFPWLVKCLPESCLGMMGCVSDPYEILPSVAAFAAVCGHIWPVYLNFRGGKGVSTAAGAILALNPLSIIAAGILWVIVFYSTRYVSLASVLAAAAMPFAAILLSVAGISHSPVPEIVLFFLLAILTIVKHSSNIRRLLQGTENRFEKKH